MPCGGKLEPARDGEDHARHYAFGVQRDEGADVGLPRVPEVQAAEQRRVLEQRLRLPRGEQQRDGEPVARGGGDGEQREEVDEHAQPPAQRRERAPRLVQRHDLQVLQQQRQLPAGDQAQEEQQRVGMRGEGAGLQKVAGGERPQRPGEGQAAEGGEGEVREAALQQQQVGEGQQRAEQVAEARGEQRGEQVGEGDPQQLVEKGSE